MIGNQDGALIVCNLALVVKFLDHAGCGVCALHVGDTGKSRDARDAEQRLQDWRHELLCCTQAAEAINDIDDTESQDDSWNELNGEQEAIAGTCTASTTEVQSLSAPEESCRTYRSAH